MKTQSKLSYKIYLALFFVGMMYSSCYSLPYLKYVFNDAMLIAMEVTNTQLGLLMSVYGILLVIGYLIGGFLADKFDYKIIYTSCGLITALTSLLFLIDPTNFMLALIIWIIWGITTGSIWAPFNKIPRMIAQDSDRGKVNGLNFAFVGVGLVFVNTINLLIYNAVEPSGGPTAGIKAMVIFSIATMVVSSILSYFTLKLASKENTVWEESDHESSKYSFKDIVEVIKLPATWIIGFTAVAINAIHITTSFFTPYFSDVLGTTVVFSGAFAIIRQYGVRIIGSPIGGFLSDKTHSVAKTVRVLALLATLLLVVILFLPNGVPIACLMAVILLYATLENTCFALPWAMIPELGIPKNLTASVVGIASIVFAIPDFTQHLLFGWFIDKFGNTGYTYMFMYTIFFGLIVVIMTSIINQKHKRLLKSNKNCNE